MTGTFEALGSSLGRDRWEAAQLWQSRLSPREIGMLATFSIPHWFDRRIVVSVCAGLGEPDGEETFRRIVELRLTKRWNDGTHSVIEGLRGSMLDRLCSIDQGFLRRASGLLHGAFSGAGRSLKARAEEIYNLAAVEPERGCEEFLEAASGWKSDPHFDYAAVSLLWTMMREHVDRGIADEPARSYLALVSSFVPGLRQKPVDEFATLGDALGVPRPPLFEAEARLRLASASLKLGDVHRSLIESDIALEIFRSLDDAIGLGDAYRFKARAYLRQDRYAEARNAYEAAIGHFEAGGGSTSVSHCRKGLAEIAFHEGRLSEAEVGFEAALAAFARTNSQLGRANTRVAFAQLRILRGDLDEATGDVTRALDEYEALDNELGRGNCLKALGSIDLARGNADAALKAFDAASRSFEKAGQDVSRANASLLVGACISRIGAPVAGLHLIREAMHRFQGIGDHGARAVGLREEGLALERTGDFRDALDCLTESVRISEALHDPVEGAITSVALGRVAATLDFPEPFDFETAKRRVEEALEFFEGAGLRPFLNDAIGVLTDMSERTAAPGV